ncbi:linear amide C-N hydrolase [Serratia marcescens]|uniref:linear amide C-N hydrolase n=1 Tax=Serratia marcescens TaxID=615 RepID=UPI000976D45C|nr:linear amide C-N hydrolase [Serratia marcescens]OMP56880.1 choloylglycine hydrolase [Serratia marcescens]
MVKKYKSFRLAPLCTAVLTAVLLTASLAEACTRILWNENTSGDKVGPLVGRTMDWPVSTDPVLTVFPRGAMRHGGQLGSLTVVTENPASWTAKYGSLVTTIYGIGAVDGINEKGLAAHLLYLNETQLPARDPSKPGLHIALWAQYALDNAATVQEALDALDSVQIVMASLTGKDGHITRGTVHLMMEDANGDSALIEYIDGKKVVHHNRDVRVVTNDPAYDQQMAVLSNTIQLMTKEGVDLQHPNSSVPLPGNVSPEDRLARASYFLALMPKPQDERQGIASILAIARNVSVPFGAPYKPKAGMAVYNTEYRTAINLRDKQYFFELTTRPDVAWVDLMKFDLSPGAPVMTFNPYQDEMNGDITSRFVRANAPY